MGRKKVEDKKKTRSISITEEQERFLESHPNFNISKFVRLHLEDYVQLSKYVEKLEKEVETDG